MLPMQRFGIPEETYWSYSLTPIRGEDGSIVGVFNSGHETTRQVLSRHQMSFLLELGEAFRSSNDLRGSRHAAIEMLGQHLKTDRVGLRELRTRGNDELTIVDEWTAPGVASVGANISISDLGPWAAGRLKAGQILKINDIRADPNLGDARENFLSLGVEAAVAIPWTDQGKVVAILFVHSRQPRSWTDFDVSTIEKVLERTMGWMERERTAERERIMMREIDHRARNALAVVQAVVRQTLADDIDAFREKIEDRIAALARTHDLLSTERWEAVELDVLLREELSPYKSDVPERINIDGPSISLRAEQAQTIALMLHELTTNAAKYGALCVADGKLDVRWTIDANGLLQIQWNETVPSGKILSDDMLKKGFGSTLLSQVVRQEAGGQWTRSFDKGGLRCVLTIPLTGRFDRARSEAQNHGETDMGNRKTILIVEDEALLAIDIASMVEELGFEVFGTVSSVEDGLSAVETGTPDLAILDANLSGQSSIPLAEAFAARGVPVIFASGYSQIGDLPASLENAPRLMKPVSATELEQTLSQILRSS